MFTQIIFSAAAVLALAQYALAHGTAHSSMHFSKHDGHPETVHGHGHHVDYHTHPKYSFGYKVEDPHTGDIKSQHEARAGDMVEGYYSLHQPDGSIRNVHYNGDHHTGFHADVKYDTHHIMPHNHHNY